MKGQALGLGALLLGIAGCAPHATPRPALEIVCGDGRVRLTEHDLLRYNWSSHTLWLRPADHGRLYAASPPKCAVLVGGSVLYEAEVVSPFDSRSRNALVFTPPLDPVETPDERAVEVRPGYPTAAFFTGTDARSNPLLRAALERAGKLVQ